MSDNTTFRYAVIDLASAATLRPIVPKLLSAAAEPLLARSFALALLKVGPWIVHLQDAPDVARILAAYGPDAPWGYYIIADIDIVSLRQALRKFNLAKLEGIRREVLFRYWDPRVLRLFLTHASAVQRGRFLEWMHRIEWPDGTVLMNQTAAELGR